MLCTHAVSAEALIERSYDISDISKLDISSPGSLTIELSDKESLVVVAAKSVHEKLKVQGNDETLIVDYNAPGFMGWLAEKKASNNADKTQYRLRLKSLSELKANMNLSTQVNAKLNTSELRIALAGAAKLKISELEVTDKLEMRLAGASIVEIDQFKGKTIESYAAGASDVTISGSVDHQSLHLSGASNHYAKNLHSKTCHLRASGASNAETWVGTTISGGLSGASNLRYYGSPRTELNISGASDIHQLGERP
jgi:hypothetical protein